MKEGVEFQEGVNRLRMDNRDKEGMQLYESIPEQGYQGMTNVPGIGAVRREIAEHITNAAPRRPRQSNPTERKASPEQPDDITKDDLPPPPPQP